MDSASGFPLERYVQEVNNKPTEGIKEVPGCDASLIDLQLGTETPKRNGGRFLEIELSLPESLFWGLNH